MSPNAELKIKKAKEFPQVTWQPTEYVPEERVKPSTEEEAFAKFGKIGEFRTPLQTLDKNLQSFPNVISAKALDLNSQKSFANFPENQFDLIHCGNVLHVCPSKGTQGLFQLAQRSLKKNGILTLAGPFKRNGEFTTKSNEEFDAKIKAINQDFGLRDVESEIVPTAIKNGLRLKEISPIPTNNFFMTFSKL